MLEVLLLAAVALVLSSMNCSTAGSVVTVLPPYFHVFRMTPREPLVHHRQAVVGEGRIPVTRSNAVPMARNSDLSGMLFLCN